MKKLLAIFVALTMLTAMAVSVSAFEGSIDVSLYAGNSSNWVTAVSDPVTVNAAGEYTLKLSGMDIDPAALTVIYIKDTAVEADGENHPKSDISADVQILTKSLKINGSEIALTEGYPTALTEAGAFDICWYNIWAVSYFSTEGLSNITDIEVVFEVVDGDASIDNSAAETAPAADTSAENTAAPADDTTSEAAPVSDSKPADTGIVLAVLPMAVAAAAVVASKRR